MWCSTFLEVRERAVEGLLQDDCLTGLVQGSQQGFLCPLSAATSISASASHIAGVLTGSPRLPASQRKIAGVVRVVAVVGMRAGARLSQVLAAVAAVAASLLRHAIREEGR
eukprot:CAMPEP_0171143076 /NCGR_PEP_ID=MMETSP0766_2-20121228/143707_1 /TAXON_ID=439317 /ORGANISM="Gambierdiscus australes, Strain CAWD 149" /LENGTH=110 /DNA_ID=CAMNT_0011606895 /DNA_START=303 /DNA_END=634 /DNA_ORIENTATION=-